MARVWTDKIVQYPRRYIITNNGDGTSTLTPSEGTVTSAGTPINSIMMNGIETDLLGKVDKNNYVANNAYAVTTGTSTAYTVTLNPVPSSYADGMQITILPHVDSGATPTLNINGLGALTIVKQDGTTIASGDIKANKPLSLVRVGSNFFIRSGSDTSLVVGVEKSKMTLPHNTYGTITDTNYIRKGEYAIYNNYTTWEIVNVTNNTVISTFQSQSVLNNNSRVEYDKFSKNLMWYSTSISVVLTTDKNGTLLSQSINFSTTDTQSYYIAKTKLYYYVGYYEKDTGHCPIRKLNSELTWLSTIRPTNPVNYSTQNTLSFDTCFVGLGNDNKLKVLFDDQSDVKNINLNDLLML